MRTSSVRVLRALLPVLAVAACAPAGTGAGAASAAATIQGERVLRDIAVLAADSMRGRRVGTPGGAMARAFLLREMRAAGLEPVGAGFEHPFTFAGAGGAQVQGVNLLGQVRGTRNPGQVIVVSAHYDHVGVGRPADGDSIYNGADDNASGTAALLEMARHFRASPPQNTLVFAFWDGEESGLRGARAFIAAPAVPRESIVLNVNMDMVSRSEKGELYAAGAAKWPFLRPYVDQVAARAPVRLIQGHDTPTPTPQDDWTMQSDQGPFHAAGIPFVYFGVEDHPGYHHPSDEVEAITPEFYVNAVRTVADVVGTLDRAADAIRQARAAMPAAPTP